MHLTINVDSSYFDLLAGAAEIQSPQDLRDITGDDVGVPNGSCSSADLAAAFDLKRPSQPSKKAAMSSPGAWSRMEATTCHSGNIPVSENFC